MPAVIQQSELFDTHQISKPESSHKKGTAGYYIGAGYHEQAFATIFSGVQFLLLNHALSEQGAKRGKKILFADWVKEGGALWTYEWTRKLVVL